MSCISLQGLVWQIQSCPVGGSIPAGCDACKEKNGDNSSDWSWWFHGILLNWEVMANDDVSRPLSDSAMKKLKKLKKIAVPTLLLPKMMASRMVSIQGNALGFV